MVKNGDRIDAGDITEALTRAPFTYTDEATQVFTRDGRTTYTENGSPTSGKWGVDDQGQFWSFWPPTYRATYDVFWIADAVGDVVGVRFTELNRGATSEGRYAPRSPQPRDEGHQ
ncbi:hypothetical protein SAMN04487916_105133 [Arthrobacter sp. ov407]|nr:hypothetical protein SAMN04487916_105133 [Arthrobacter sp. ov407]